MRGEIRFSKTEIDKINLDWSIFDMFEYHLRQITDSKRAGWIAYKLENGIYRFKWVDTNESWPSLNYLRLLKNDGWNLGITSTTIEDAFK